MMTFNKIVLMGVLMAGVSAPAMAETAITGNLGFTTDYVFRGVSQTDESAAIQGGFDVEHDSGLHAGVWASNIDFNNTDDGSLEMDIYAGFANEIAGFTYDVGGIYYTYPGSDEDLNYDFWEAYISGGYDFGVAAVTVGVNYSPDFFGETGDATYVYGDVDVPLPYEFSFNAHIGNQSIDDSDDYVDWSASVSRTWLEFDWAASYYDTDIENDDNADTRFVLSVSKSF